MRYIKAVKESLKKQYIKATAPLRRKKLTHKDFTIISNNCWGGYVYRYFGLPYLSPFAGLYVWADDYIKLLGNIEHYLNCPLMRVELEESKYRDEIVRRKQQNVLLARLDDVEMVMLHYVTWEEAKEKWDRRVARVNYNNLVVKFSRQNLCTDKHIAIFESMKYEKKVFFDNQPSSCLCSIYIPGYENLDYLGNDIDGFVKYMDICQFVNNGELKKT